MNGGLAAVFKFNRKGILEIVSLKKRNDFY